MLGREGMDSTQVMLYLLLTVYVILPITTAHHRNSGSCVEAGHHGCCTSGCRVGSCYCDRRCYRHNDCCYDIEEIGCYSHGTSLGTSQFLSSTVMLTTNPLTISSKAVAMTNPQMPSTISPATTTSLPDTLSEIRPYLSTHEHESLPLPVTETLTSSFPITTVHVDMTRLEHPHHSFTYSHTTSIPTSSAKATILVTPTKAAVFELTMNGVSQIIDVSTTAAVITNLDTYQRDNDYSTNNQAFPKAKSTENAAYQSRYTLEKMMLTSTESIWVAQPSSTTAISVAQEGLSVPWIILAAALPMTIFIIAVLIIVFFCCFAIRKRDMIKNLDATNQPSATTVHELSYVQHSTSQSMEHIYSVPQQMKREACSSMIYNQAYSQSFAITINAAYGPTISKK